MSIVRTEDLKTIGIFNDSFPPIMDGVSLVTKNYAHWLHKKNQPVCVVTPKSPNHTDNEPYHVFRYTSIPILGRKPYRFGLPDIDLSFKTELEQISFGLVHAHCPFSSGRIALSIAKKQQIPFVATFHSKYRDDFEHSVHNKFLAKQMTNEIVRFYEKADEVWISQSSVEETIREYGFKGKLEIVPFGNDFINNEPIESLKSNARKKLNISDRETVFLFVGQHVWEKNIKLIVESLALINDLPFKMIFIGSGYAKDDLILLANKLGILPKIDFIGVISDRELLKQYYAAADLFLFPSTYDTWALVVREAAALCTPSLLVKESTVANIITDNFNGFLTANSIDSFASKLRELVSNPVLIKNVGLNSSKTLTRSWESVTEEVLDRYQKLMKRTWRK
jgi:glycosyltransferase involved in cell wall biosynthesis